MINTACPFLIDLDSYKGIIKITYKDRHEFTLDNAEDLVSKLGEITNGQTLPILKILEQSSSISNEARKFIASSEGMKYSSAEAFVTTYLAHRIIGNFYMKVNKPIKPTAFFETEEQAVAWLQKFK